jgi:cytochrome c oxidase subunit 3
VIHDAHEDAAHHPMLQHHFDTMEQQKDASMLGMWIFLVTEIMFFGGMFAAYLVYRYWFYNEFVWGSTSLSIWWGGINTLVLIFSSLTMALAVHCAQLGMRKMLMFFLACTLVLGFAFLGIKGKEYTDKYNEHHIPGHHFHFGEVTMADGSKVDVEKDISQQRMQIFFSLYFALTGMHAMHMIIGAGLLSTLLFMAWKGKFSASYYTPVENIGLYWHFVDIVWIFLFPLLYLISRVHH